MTSNPFRHWKMLTIYTNYNYFCKKRKNHVVISVYIAPFHASGLNCDDLIGRMIYE